MSARQTVGVETGCQLRWKEIAASHHWGLLGRGIVSPPARDPSPVGFSGPIVHGPGRQQESVLGLLGERKGTVEGLSKVEGLSRLHGLLPSAGSGDRSERAVGARSLQGDALGEWTLLQEPAHPSMAGRRRSTSHTPCLPGLRRVLPSDSEADELKPLPSSPT